MKTKPQENKLTLIALLLSTVFLTTLAPLAGANDAPDTPSLIPMTVSSARIIVSSDDKLVTYVWEAANQSFKLRSRRAHDTIEVQADGLLAPFAIPKTELSASPSGTSTPTVAWARLRKSEDGIFLDRQIYTTVIEDGVLHPYQTQAEPMRVDFVKGDWNAYLAHEPVELAAAYGADAQELANMKNRVARVVRLFSQKIVASIPHASLLPIQSEENPSENSLTTIRIHEGLLELATEHIRYVITLPARTPAEGTSPDNLR